LLWTPSAQRVAATRLTAFRHVVATRYGFKGTDFSALQGFALERPDDFWSALWDFTGVIGDKGDRAFVDGPDMRDARFFPDASMNVAETMLARSDDVPALLFAREDGMRSVTTWSQLQSKVADLAYALLDAGVEPGDVVAAWLPNIPEAYVTALAAAAIGALYSSTSPDFGSSGVLERFGQVGPKVLVATDSYVYGGRTHDCLGRLKEIRAGLPATRVVVVVPGLAEAPDVSGIDGAVMWSDFARPTDRPPPFRRLPFDAPLYILYSSGTTGPPKCIVHRAGGVLLTVLKEHQLHCDVRRGDRVFYYTTTGWMMWNWLAGALASQASVVVYDGSPVHPSPASLFDLVDEFGITLFGTSAKFLDTARKAGIAANGELASLRTITSTGSPLSAGAFEYVYRDISSDVHLASISGGTDICGCFVIGDPTRPVYSGEIQGPALGMAVDIFDETGNPAPVGSTGELVCTRPFPSMPLGLWADADGSAYEAAYFAAYPGVWRHGDWASRTAHEGFVISGRSDATLNPGGVRIGTAEIYRQVDQLPQVVESVAVGQRRGDDERVVLFVHLADGVELDDELAAAIRSVIRSGCSPRHVPEVIVSVPDVPRTRSGKLVELAVRNVVDGRRVSALEALANPESLEYFRDRLELR
jgi:acetoacetyl-CoA synthetase